LLSAVVVVGLVAGALAVVQADVEPNARSRSLMLEGQPLKQLPLAQVVLVASATERALPGVSLRLVHS